MAIEISSEELEVVINALNEASFQLNDRVKSMHPTGQKLTIEAIKLIADDFNSLMLKLSVRDAVNQAT